MTPPRTIRSWSAALTLLGVAVSGSHVGAAETGAEEFPIKNLVDQGGVPPKPVKRAAPVYPYGAARMGLVGEVTVDFVITEKGDVWNPVVVRSNNPWFERPAIAAILEWKFRPAELRGKPVATRATQQLIFQATDRNGRAIDLWQVKRSADPESLPPELRWDKPPQPLASAYPVYPWDDLVAETAGHSRIRVLVDPTGRVAKATVDEATTPAMGLAALAMAETWRFTPPTKKDGTPCFAAFTMEHDFSPGAYAGDVPVSSEARDILRWLKKSPEKIATVSQLDEKPRPLSRRPPVYPLGLREARQGGSAMIEFFIDRHGDAQLPRIISSTAPEFGYAAVQAVATWRFAVPKRAGKPVATRVRIPLDFAPLAAASADNPPASK